ncbi:MAG: response regulator, partial [Candidatus Dormibacteria bacterium]
MIESSTPRVDRVLVVLRPASRSEAMQRALEKLGLVMVSFESSAAAAAALDETPVAAVLLDVAGEDSGLVPLIRQIRSSILHAAIPVVLAVADPDSPLVAAALDAGASERVLRSSPAQAVADILQSRIETAASPQ